MSNPRGYPDTLASAESGRPMVRGEKDVTIKVDGKPFRYEQPGWWCSLTDPEDMEGQLTDEDNQIADTVRRNARALGRGETVFLPIVIRAIRQACGLTQREAGTLFGTGDKSFEKYESGEISPSEPSKRLLSLAMRQPDLFRKPAKWEALSVTDAELVGTTVRKANVEGIYARLLATTLQREPKPI